MDQKHINRNLEYVTRQYINVEYLIEDVLRDALIIFASYLPDIYKDYLQYRIAKAWEEDVDFQNLVMEAQEKTCRDYKAHGGSHPQGFYLAGKHISPTSLVLFEEGDSETTMWEILTLEEWFTKGLKRTV